MTHHLTDPAFELEENHAASFSLSGIRANTGQREFAGAMYCRSTGEWCLDIHRGFLPRLGSGVYFGGLRSRAQAERLLAEAPTWERTDAPVKARERVLREV